jgi:cysteine desulfurase
LIYLDNNATTEPAPEVLAAMERVHREAWGNPSSVHRFGQLARQQVDLARAQVARLLHAKPREIVFTSGGTESNNLALRGILTGEPPRSSAGGPAAMAPAVLVTSRLEHSAIRQPAEALVGTGAMVLYVPSDRAGLISCEALAATLDTLPAGTSTVLVSLQWANNETGVIQAIGDLAARSRAFEQTRRQTNPQFRLFFHSDATQAVGKIAVDVAATGVDLLTFSAHKFHGPKGVGGLYVRQAVRLRPQNLGGPQEMDRRGGTENTPAIVGAGVAAELAERFLADTAAIESLHSLRDHFESLVRERLPESVINSGGAPRLWNTSNIGFPQLEAEAILLTLSERGVCASAGAACSSGSLDPSPVLLAMGVHETVAHGSLRFSLSKHTTREEIDAAAAIVVEAVVRLRRTLPVGT